MRLQPQRAWLNDRWRNLRGYTARDGTWRFVGAGAAVTALLSGAMIAGGVGRNATPAAIGTPTAEGHSSRFNDWAGFRGPTTTQAPTTTVAKPAPVVKHTAPPKARRSVPPSGDFASCVRQKEAGGNYATNTGNGYHGAYQMTNSHWAGYGGYASADQAPPAVQDAKFASDVAQGAAYMHQQYPVTSRACGMR